MLRHGAALGDFQGLFVEKCNLFFPASRGMVTANQRTELFYNPREALTQGRVLPLSWKAGQHKKPHSQKPGSLQETQLWLQRLECVIPWAFLEMKWGVDISHSWNSQTNELYRIKVTQSWVHMCNHEKWRDGPAVGMNGSSQRTLAPFPLHIIILGKYPLIQTHVFLSVQCTNTNLCQHRPSLNSVCKPVREAPENRNALCLRRCLQAYSLCKEYLYLANEWTLSHLALTSYHPSLQYLPLRLLPGRCGTNQINYISGSLVREE